MGAAAGRGGAHGGAPSGCEGAPIGGTRAASARSAGGQGRVSGKQGSVPAGQGEAVDFFLREQDRQEIAESFLIDLPIGGEMDGSEAPLSDFLASKILSSREEDDAGVAAAALDVHQAAPTDPRALGAHAAQDDADLGVTVLIDPGRFLTVQFQEVTDDLARFSVMFQHRISRETVAELLCLRSRSNFYRSPFVYGRLVDEDVKLHRVVVDACAHG